MENGRSYFPIADIDDLGDSKINVEEVLCTSRSERRVVLVVVETLDA